MLIRKCNNLELKDLDTKKGIVTFYGSTFGSKDSDNDIIIEGAFKKTIEENRNRIKHFKDHDPAKPIGLIQSISEDGVGLIITSKLSKNSFGRDALIEYEEGLITEHSIGFNTLQSEPDEMSGATIIKEVRLWEASSLGAWGANQNTPVVDLKNMDSALSLLKKLNKVLQTTAISDEKAIALEKEYKKLEKAIKSLSISPEPSNDTKEDDKPIDYLNHFKINLNL